MKDTSKLNDGGLAFYSYADAEYTVLIGSRNDAKRHGNALKWGYANKYLWMIRMINGSPRSSDWEKISAGYADSAGSVAWDNVTNKPATATRWPSWTEVTDKLVSGNEFNIVNAGFNNRMWFNYLPINDRSKTATISNYCFGNGHEGYATVTASGFVKNGSSSSYVLLGNGDHKALSDFSMAHSHPYLPLSGGTLTGTLGKSNNYIFKPNGGDFRANTNVYTGAICISLPANIGNTMLSMWIDVYNYSYNTSFSVHVGGYTYTNSTFQHSPFAMVYGASHKVRLTYNNGFKIYIGEINTEWWYPQISIRDVVLGHNQNYSNWYNDWSVSFVTSFPSINAEITRYTITTDNISSQSVNYASSAGNADTVDGQHFSYSNSSNSPTYLWATNSTGSSFLAARASISVNYANSAGSATKVIVN